MSALAFGRRGAMRQHFLLRIAAGDDIGDGKRAVHLDTPVAQPLHRHVGAKPLQLPGPIGVDLVGPNRVERARLSEVQQEQGQDPSRQNRRIEHREFDGGTH